MRLTLALLSTLIFCVSVLAHPGHEAPAMPKDFETLKKLVGTWEGSSKKGDKEDTIKVIYELTSGGTAITEKLNPGTPHEMVSVYHREGKTLAMTHYCALGNHPTMMLKKVSATSIAFEMTKPMGVSSVKESHMHALTLKMPDADTLEQEWVNYENGKPAQTVVFTLKRKN